MKLFKHGMDWDEVPLEVRQITTLQGLGPRTGADPLNLPRESGRTFLSAFGSSIAVVSGFKGSYPQVPVESR